MFSKNLSVALGDYFFQAFPYFKYALRDMCCLKILIYYRNFEKKKKKKIKKCITNEEEGTSSSVLHCNVTVAAWRRENTRDVGAALQRSGKIGGKRKQFSAEIFWSGPMTA